MITRLSLMHAAPWGVLFGLTALARAQAVDRMAAVLILQSFMQSRSLN